MLRWGLENCFYFVFFYLINSDMFLSCDKCTLHVTWAKASAKCPKCHATIEQARINLELEEWWPGRKEPSLPSRTVLSALTGKCLGRQQPPTAPLTWRRTRHQLLVSSRVRVCIDDVTVKSITMRSNQKPWMTAEVRALLRARDIAFRAGDKEALAQQGLHWPRLSGVLNEHMPRKSITTTLHLAFTHLNKLTHLNKKDTYARMLFIDCSSAFNTIIPKHLIRKLSLLGPNTSLCNWILDFLTRRP